MLSDFKFGAANLALKGLRKARCLLVRCGVQPIIGTERMAHVSSSGVAAHHTRHRALGLCMCGGGDMCVGAWEGRSEVSLWLCCYSGSV